jgi:hypothetical protein
MDTKKIDLGAGKAPRYTQMDVYLNKYQTGRLIFGNRGPIQRLKIWFIGKYILKMTPR